MLRITRGETLALREAEFVPAAVASGAGDATVIFRHILPNMLAAADRRRDAHASRTRSSARRPCRTSGSGCSYPPPRGAGCCTPRSRYLYQAPRLAIFPGVAIVLVALAFNLLGDALRDVLDPKTAR